MSTGPDTSPVSADLSRSQSQPTVPRPRQLESSAPMLSSRGLAAADSRLRQLETNLSRILASDTSSSPRELAYQATTGGLPSDRAGVRRVGSGGGGSDKKVATGAREGEGEERARGRRGEGGEAVEVARFAPVLAVIDKLKNRDLEAPGARWGLGDARRNQRRPSPPVEVGGMMRVAPRPGAATVTRLSPPPAPPPPIDLVFGTSSGAVIFPGS
jgi:hypothetical protein